MATKTTRYTLDNINSILFNGFEYKLPDETLEIISNLALQVGSPDYVKTPVFKKRENPMKTEHAAGTEFKKSGKRGKAVEIVNDDDWEAIRSFQTTKIEEKVGIEAQIDSVRVLLNKITDKNYIDMRNKIIDAIDSIIQQGIAPEELLRFSTAIFDIASANRFFSKIYAELYSDLSTKYEILKTAYENNLVKFTSLFDIVEYVDPQVNYDKFCEINKANEKRKALASFYLNLMNNGIIPKIKIIQITRNILSQIYTFISLDDKKNQVDELTETFAILYKKEIYYDDDGEDYDEIGDGFTINEVVDRIAKSKVKDYKSLTNKSLFKFMDLVDM
jgi:hypothetical protein